MRPGRKHIWGMILCLYIAAVAYLCFAEPDELPKVHPDLWGIPFDKAVHFLMFFPFPIAAYGTFMPDGNKKWTHILVLAAVCAAGAGLAIGTEHIQGLTEYRSQDINDFYADILGMGTAAIITLIYILTRKNKN